MILIINDHKDNAIAYSDMFYFMGVLSRAATVREAFSDFSDAYSAVLIFLHENDRRTFELLSQLKAIAPTLPIFTVGNTVREYAPFCAMTFETSALAPSILTKIIEYTANNSMRIPGDYRLAGINASADLPSPTYFDDPIPFTRTESMIIRYLIRAYPDFVSADKILKFSYRESRRPEPSNIKTHISIINKKFRLTYGRCLIETEFGKGYRILTPENLTT